MVKTKQNSVAGVVPKSNDSSSVLEVNSDLPEDDSWVVVKKQKVNILIPHLSSSERCRLSDPVLPQGQSCADMPNTVDLTSAVPRLPNQYPRDKLLADGHDSGISPQQFTLPDKAASNPEPMKISSRAHSIEHQDDVVKPLSRKKRSLMHFHEITNKPCRAFGEPGQSKANSPGCITILDKTMRASNLKIKIARAGGLRRWLFSLGLEQFERIFHGKSINKFQVANLSMDKLKEMGYLAVGPRRKLIHAVECPC